VFARVATFDGVDLDAMGPVREWFREHGPELSAQLPGYQGGLSLLDRRNRRGMEILLFDNEVNARSADELLDQGPPPTMPDELKDVVMRGTRSFRGVLEVADADGRAGQLVDRGAS
jgi:hypothetical protein